MCGERGIDVKYDPGAAWASNYFTKTFEKPKNTDAIAASRASHAQQLLNGVSGAASVPSYVASSSSTSSAHTDNSRVTNIGTINLQNPAGSASVTPSMARGMDWNTLLTQQNAGLIP